MGKRKSPKQNLRRPKGFTIRFNKAEISKFNAAATRTRLSMSEFARRKILDIPVGVQAPQPPEEQSGPKTVA